MLVKCERCGAGYEFPVDQIPPDGLRAKCAACGHVMHARASGSGDEADFDDVEMSVDLSMNDAPPQVVPARIIEPVPLGRIGRALSTAPPPVDTPSPGASAPGLVGPPAEFAAMPSAPPPEATPAPPGQVPPKVVDVDEDAVVSRAEDAQASVGFRIDPKERERRDAEHQAEADAKAQAKADAEDLPPTPTDADEIAEPTPTPKPGEPSIVVDLDHLGESTAPTPDRPTDEETDQVQAFAPLSSTSSMPRTPKPAMREAATMLVAAQHEPADPADIKPVRPPSLFGLSLALLLLALGGFVAYLSWANDWRPVWEEPELSMRVAFGLVERKAPPPPRAPEIVEPEPMRGNLEVKVLNVEVVRIGRRKRAAIVQAQLVNGSNRRQGKIQLEATLSSAPGAMALKTRRLGCCTAISTKEAAAIAGDANHPHFQEGRSSALKLDPAQSQPFTVVFRDIDLTKAYASVTVTYSEPERPSQ